MIVSMVHRWSGVGRGVVAFGLLAIATGCGRSAASKSSPARTRVTSSGASETSTTNVKPKDLCTVITPADAAELFGETAESTPSSGAEKLVSGLCLYHHPGDALTVRNLLQIRIYPGAQFYGERLFPKRAALSGLGSRAFEDVNPALHKVVIQLVKDGATGVVDYSTGAGVDVRTRTSIVRSLAKKLASSM